MNDDMEIISIMVTRLEADEIRKAASIIKKRNGSRGVSIKEYILLHHNDWLVKREEIPEQSTGVHIHTLDNGDIVGGYVKMDFGHAYLGTGR